MLWVVDTPKPFHSGWVEFASLRPRADHILYRVARHNPNVHQDQASGDRLAMRYMNRHWVMAVTGSLEHH